jgi:copper(I)-binding protein
MRAMPVRLVPLALMLAACSGGEPDIAVGEAWAGASAPGQKVGAAYFTVSNRGGGADRLLSVISDAGSAASLHNSSVQEGIARMRPLPEGLEIAGGASAVFAPGGNHVMLTGLKQPLAAGQTIGLTLRFERSGERQVRAAVRPAMAHAGH